MNVFNSLSVVLITLFMVGCSGLEERPAMDFTIDVIESTGNTVTFTVSSENVQDIAYLVERADKTPPHPKYVLASGKRLSPNKTEKVTVNGLSVDLSYVIYVAAGFNGEYEMKDARVESSSEEQEKPNRSFVSYSSLLEEMVSFDSATRYPSVSYRSRQASSYDRRSVSPNEQHWCANDDGWGYERMEINSGREEKVIFDERHPGVITRIWLTSFGSPKTIVRFYLDGDKEPTWQMNSFDLNDFAAEAGVKLGKSLVFPDQEWIRGSALYLPVSYGSSCKITVEELVEPITVSRYYHINYREYPDGYEVEKLTPEVLISNSSSISAINDALSSPKISGGQQISKKVEMKAGESTSLGMPEGTKAIDLLTIEVAHANSTDLQQAMNELSITGTFDGVTTFDLPLKELAGAGEGAYYLNSWRFSVNGRGKFTLRWKMPYREGATVQLTNNSSKDISVSVTAKVSSYAWDNSSLYFHAAHRSENNVKLTHFSNYPSCIDWKFGHISGGRGVLVGDVYTIDNPYAEWPGEGDEKIWVDDETFPSHFGTGVEDYYSFCGYFRFHTPFSGEPRLDAENFQGYNVHYRTRNLDAIPFRDRLRFDLEMLGWANGSVNVRSTVFWYGDAYTTSN